ncbi:uncharacterized protein LOC120427177 [Culex pipiens pallens]|uniref:uncharacterized protein LOC120427177 n=1 Tax=Culex pipiens pallens TaxID=42434 RepID=UPI0019548B18|nr:uncharacterized protein LOC120427177 [Culex pipiens pallens]
MDRSQQLFFVVSVSVLLFIGQAISEDALFGYKEDPEDNPYRLNANNRTPVYIPGRCGLNEILYPGDQAVDWVCDCRPAHVYHPASGGCYALFTQAYCAAGEFVEIPPGDKLPRCTKNPCPEKQVQFREKCVTLNRNNEGTCPTVQHIRHVVGVNETTLQLDCLSYGTIDLKRPQKQRVDVMEDHSDEMAMPNLTKINDVVLANMEGHLFFLTATRCAIGSAAHMNGTCTN